MPRLRWIGASRNSSTRRAWVLHPQLSLAGGAIRGWDRRNAYYFQMIQALALHYRFDIEAPWVNLPEKVQYAVLHGSGEEPINFRYVDARGRSAKRAHPFEGILPNLERRFRETESATVREELGKYRARDAARVRWRAPEPHGAPCARGQFDVARNRATVRGEGDGALRPTRGWPAGAARSRRASSRKSPTGCAFLVDVGLDYLTPRPQRGDFVPVAKRQRIRLASQVGSGLTGVLYILDEPPSVCTSATTSACSRRWWRLRDLGNTVLVVEHDEEAILTADHVLDIGPGAGVHGGHVVAQGTPAEVARQPRLADRRPTFPAAR